MSATRLSFWERHEYKFYKYGHIYASIYGQAAIDYIPQQPLRPAMKILFVVYSHVLSLLLIVVLPCYFGYHFEALVNTSDRNMQLLLYVSFVNTFIKYATVVVTYIANTVHFKAINHRCTLQRQRLEDAFLQNCRDSRRAKTHFEFLMYFKFCLINTMMIIQVCGICAQRSASWLRMYFAIYSFVLWNYTENTADYFYFVNSSVLKYHQQLNQQLCSTFGQCCLLWCRRQRERLCDRLIMLRNRFWDIHLLYIESFKIHQFQLLGIALTTLINNLTNFFTIFNMLAKQSLDEITYPIVISMLYALGFYIDTYIITLVNDDIRVELKSMALTMRTFSEKLSSDAQVDQEIEHFSLKLLHCRHSFQVCGLLHFDRRLVYLIAVTGFAYFITLVQFDLHLRKAQSSSH